MAMILSSRARYGVRAMFQLACHWGEGPVVLRTVAEEQDLSLAYLEQLVAVMRRSGLVESVRGRKGGYQLARHPADISVGQIIRALEGPVFVAACADPDPDFDDCGRGSLLRVAVAVDEGPSTNRRRLRFDNPGRPMRCLSAGARPGAPGADARVASSTRPITLHHARLASVTLQVTTFEPD